MGFRRSQVQILSPRLIKPSVASSCGRLLFGFSWVQENSAKYIDLRFPALTVRIVYPQDVVPMGGFCPFCPKRRSFPVWRSFYTTPSRKRIYQRSASPPRKPGKNRSFTLFGVVPLWQKDRGKVLAIFGTLRRTLRDLLSTLGDSWTIFTIFGERSPPLPCEVLGARSRNSVFRHPPTPPTPPFGVW